VPFGVLFLFLFFNYFFIQQSIERIFTLVLFSFAPSVTVFAAIILSTNIFRDNHHLLSLYKSPFTQC